LAARTPAELRQGRAGLNREFLHRVGNAKIRKRRLGGWIHAADAVDLSNVRLRTSAGDVEAAQRADIRGTTPGVNSARSRNCRVLRGMLEIVRLLTTWLSVLLSGSKAE